ncbi:hypothetical protein CSKR_102776, partial [Clonorchis sinensis]
PTTERSSCVPDESFEKSNLFANECTSLMSNIVCVSQLPGTSQIRYIEAKFALEKDILGRLEPIWFYTDADPNHATQRMDEAGYPLGVNDMHTGTGQTLSAQTEKRVREIYFSHLNKTNCYLIDQNGATLSGKFWRLALLANLQFR